MRFWAVNLLVVFLSAGLVLDAFADDKPLRVVSVNGALTEIIYQLGAEHTLVGVDTTSKYPVQAQSLPQVGYQRSLSIEGVLSLTPTHVIASADAGPPATLIQMQDAGIELIQFEKNYSLEGVVSKIESLAELLGLTIRVGEPRSQIDVD